MRVCAKSDVSKYLNAEQDDLPFALDLLRGTYLQVQL
jgi:hypothetical protein